MLFNPSPVPPPPPPPTPPRLPAVAVAATPQTANATGKMMSTQVTVCDLTTIRKSRPPHLLVVGFRICFASPCRQPPMQGSQLEDGDAAPRPIGKKELLLWATEVTGTMCNKFEDLRDGVIIVKLISSIWPRAVDPRNSRKMKAAPQLDWELKRNWDTIKEIMTEIRLPVQLVDRAAIQQGRFRACYNLLVMLFFMMSLTKHREFSVDFAHPIDPRLSAFLQSNASIDALSRCGALSVQPSDTDEGDDGLRDSVASSRSGAAQVSPGPVHDHASSSPSGALKSDVVLSGEVRTSRSNSTEQPHSSSLQASAIFGSPHSSSSKPDHPPTSSSNLMARSSAASDRIGDRASLRSAPPTTRSLLSNALVFNSLEQTVIDLFNDFASDASNFDAVWKGATNCSTDDAISFAEASSWLQQAFPDLRDIEATRLAFERAAEGRRASAPAHSSSAASLSRSDFADFLIRVLYYHRLPPPSPFNPCSPFPQALILVKGFCGVRICAALSPRAEPSRNKRRRLCKCRSVKLSPL